MELWDVYDRNRIPTGRTHERGKPLAEGDYHLSVHICIFTTDGRLLIQRRTPDRTTFAGLWDISAAGSVIAGESSQMGAERELREELGLVRDLSGVRPHITLNYRDGFGDHYLLIEDVPLESVIPQPEEVSEVAYATLDEVIELIRDGRFIAYHEGFIRMLFDLRHAYSSHQPNAKK